ncbi:hypothetical protein SDC9_43872 [bioreactor metagenome]|uniref:Sulfatase-modifying factor enzyme domain-containing protein n=1 Tax=bioreactor metagenome TaxID=1076179 RepID=A0A644W2L6_9ZZZZ
MTGLQKFELDITGFPMIWSESINCYIQFFPFSKIQFELFMASSHNPLFNAENYSELIILNPRVSPNNIHKDNYWQAFLTGVKPNELEEITRWYQSTDQQNTYKFFSLEEWNAIYFEFSRKEPIRDLSVIPTKNKRISLLIEKLGNTYKYLRPNNNRSFSLKDQMLFQYGVVEWVSSSHSNHKWIGMGQPNPDFRTVVYSPEQGVPEYPIAPYQDRLFYYGFRLLRN